MLMVENTEVFGFGAAMRGMRNPYESWDRNDTMGELIGTNDLILASKLANAGDDHGKFLRQIIVSADIRSTFTWWKEYDTYKVGTVANSCSTMHSITKKRFSMQDFSTERLDKFSLNLLQMVIDRLNEARNAHLSTGDKSEWFQIIDLLPMSYLQTRTVTLNYQVLRHMYTARKNHKLPEWRQFCSWVESLPYAKELITG